LKQINDFLFSSKIFSLKGQKFIAGAEGKIFGDTERVGQTDEFDPYRVQPITIEFRGLRAKPLAHGY